MVVPRALVCLRDAGACMRACARAGDAAVACSRRDVRVLERWRVYVQVT
jgi:hypothetical protein